MSLWLMLVSSAFAAGFYHPADIARESALYDKAAATAGGTFEQAQKQAEAYAIALRDYELALDLLGERAPAGERERQAQLEKEFHREFAVLEAFANTMMEDFDAVFGAALERALAKHPGAVECEAVIATGAALPGMPAPTKKNPACKGDDLNATIAKAMDGDATLRRELDEILGLPWPELKLDAAPQPVVGGGTRYVHVDAMFRKLAPDALRRIDQQDEDARLPLQAAVEEGTAKRNADELRAKAAAIDQATRDRRAALAAPVLSAAQAASEKWAKKGEPTVGFCANPATLGGCSGTEATDAIVARWAADKKVLAALP